MWSAAQVLLLLRKFSTSQCRELFLDLRLFTQLPPYKRQAADGREITVKEQEITLNFATTLGKVHNPWQGPPQKNVCRNKFFHTFVAKKKR